MERADIIIVGAGVVGLFTALEAANRGLHPIVIEAAEPGAGASTKNAGVLHLIQPPPGRLRRKLAPIGASLYRLWSEKMGFKIIETKLIIAALGRAQELLLRPTLSILKRITPGIRARILKGRELLEIEPILNPRVRAGILVERYGVVEPRELVKRLAQRVEEVGAIVKGVRVEELKCVGESVVAEASNGERYAARWAVNSAGAGSWELARMHGVKVGVKLKPGTMELYQYPRPSTIIARLPTSLKTKGGAVIPWPQGVLFGPDLRESPASPPPRPGEVAARYLNLISEKPRGLIEVIEGERTVAKPRDFHIIRPRTCPNTVHLLGIESPGLTAAPALAGMALDSIGIHI
jgi:glycerol-3-phosphate dehydrogenase